MSVQDGSGPAAEALARAAAQLQTSGALPWSSPSRFGAAGLTARKGLQRVMKPYAVRQRVVDKALLDAVRAAGEEFHANLVALELQARANRLLALATALDADGVVDAETAMGPFWLNKADTLVTPGIVEHKMYEPHVTAVIQRHLRPGQTFVDVGANIGWYSVLGSKLVGEGGRVIAVEPAANNLPLLRANLWRNKAANATVLPVAAYAHTGHVEMMMNAEGGAGNWVQPGIEGGVLVPCARLDDVLAGRRVDVLKTDAEGSDDQAIRGMEATIAANPDIVIVCEWWVEAYGGHGSRPAEVLGYYGSLGFVFHLVTDYGEEKPMTPHQLLALAGQVPFVNLVLRRG